MTALAAEVIWTRLLSLLFGATTYTFSLILAVFLIGLGIGSSVGSALARGLVRPRLALGVCQMLLCGAIAWTAYMLTESLPYWPINPADLERPWFNFQLDFVRCLWAVLPAAILWGASFPLALASVASPGQDPARLVGGVYAANTVGAIVGALGASLLVGLARQPVRRPVAHRRLRDGGAADAGAGVRGRGSPQDQAPVRAARRGGRLRGDARAQRARVPGLLVGYGRYAATRVGQADIIYVGEGWNASVAVSRLSDGVLNYHNAGKVQASSEPQDMRLQRMLGHLTTLIPEHPRSVLVIGCGAGVTAGAVSIDPTVERETIAEIEPLVPSVGLHLFRRAQLQRRPEPEGARADRRRAALHPDDEGEVRRRHLGSARPVGEGRGDALHAGVLRARSRQHLNPGGAVTLFVQLYESNTAAVKSEIATFFEAFPERRRLGQHQQRRGLRPRAARARSSRRASTSTRSRRTS